MIKELKQFLCSKNTFRILSVSSTSPGSTAVKVFAALETLRDFKHQDSYLVVSSNRLNDIDKIEQWKRTLEFNFSSKLLIIVCENGVHFHEIYNQLGSDINKKVIIINRSHQGTLETTPGICKEIQDRPWLSLECIQINVKQTSQERLRNTLLGVLSETHNRKPAVVFIQGKIQGDISSLKFSLSPENYKLIHNRTENNTEEAEGFAAIVVHRSLDFQRILPSWMVYNPKLVAGIQLSCNESSLSLYSVYHCVSAKDLSLESNASSKTVVCASPVADYNPEKEVECKTIHWPEGNDIRHGNDVHVSNLERLQSPDGNQYIRFSILRCCCFEK
jgi:hypothetical protein